MFACSVTSVARILRAILQSCSWYMLKHTLKKNLNLIVVFVRYVRFLTKVSFTPTIWRYWSNNLHCQFCLLICRCFFLRDKLDVYFDRWFAAAFLTALFLHAIIKLFGCRQIAATRLKAWIALLSRTAGSFVHDNIGSTQTTFVRGPSRTLQSL